jgi:hypothetical protein
MEDVAWNAPAVERPVSALRTAELLLLASLRLYALSWHAPRAPDWREGLRAADVSRSAVSALGRFLAIVAFAARRSLEVRCMHCGIVSEDENRFLQIIGLLQDRRPMEAMRILCAWLPPAACRLAADPAEMLANSLAVSGLIVPCGAARQSVPSCVPYLNANPGLALMQ